MNSFDGKVAYHGMRRLTLGMTLRSCHTASRSNSPSPSFVVTAKAHERAYSVDISGLVMRRARQLRLQQLPSPDLRNVLCVERMGGVVAVSFLLLCISPVFPYHALFFYPSAVPWSAIWPSPTHVPACCPIWPRMPTPDGALGAPPLESNSATCPSVPIALASSHALVLSRSATVARSASKTPSLAFVRAGEEHGLFLPTTTGAC